MVIERVAINPTLQANTFSMPGAPSSKHGGVMVNITGPEPPGVVHH